MGTGGFRTTQGRNSALSDIVKKEIKFVLQVSGHRDDNPEIKVSYNAPLSSLEELTRTKINSSVHKFEQYGNILEKLELYRVSIQRLKYESIEHYKKPSKK